MSDSLGVPSEIMDTAQLIHELQQKANPTRSERDRLNRAKLKIAFWVCQMEGIVASRENLAYILGNDARDIMAAYDKYLAREQAEAEGGAAKGEKGSKSGFWEST